jgi:hypothetical protein
MILEEIKKIPFYGTGEVGFFEDEEIEEDLFTLYSDEYLIKTKDETYIGYFNTEPLSEIRFYSQEVFFIDDVIDSYNVYFIGTNAQQEEINIKLSEIIFFKLIKEISSISEEINNDIEQPQRAISNYLIRESQETELTQKEFYQMVIDSAQHELNLI